MKWTDEVFNLIPVPPEVVEKIFVPLTEEEIARVPIEWEPAECKTSQHFLPVTPTKKIQRVLRPTMKEMMMSTGKADSIASMIDLDKPES